MKAGRELDALVAVRVMELTPCDRYSRDRTYAGLVTDGNGFSGVRHYSMEIDVAWDVVEKMEVAGWLLQLTRVDGEITEPRLSWEAEFRQGNSSAWASGETAALAICLAALDVVGAKSE